MEGRKGEKREKRRETGEGKAQGDPTIDGVEGPVAAAAAASYFVFFCASLQ